MTQGAGKRRGLLALCLLGTALFGSLGSWQVQRLAWKRDLIARVEERIHAPPVAPPPRREWTRLDLHDWEYRRVQVRGVYRHDHAVLVDALTVLGPGAWVLTPLETADGVIFINQGFIPAEQRKVAGRSWDREVGEVMITGLLRESEPGGRILRANDPAADRWFSRDVAAMAAARGLGTVAPFFVDAENTSGPAGAGPVGSLTVVRFRNAHLAYALTWFGLAALCVTGLVMTRKPPIPTSASAA